MRRARNNHNNGNTRGGGGAGGALGGGPLVGVVIDGVSSYGRGVLRGVMRYANLQRRWLLHEDLWRATESLRHFPECDGAIIAGAGGGTFDFIRQRCRHVIYCSGAADPAICPVVSLDDNAAGVMSAHHLMDCRLERFAFYGNAGAGESTVAAKRLVGFRDALAARGFSCLESPVLWPSGNDWLTHAHRPRLVEWLRSLPKPIGIMAVDDAAGHDLAGACLEAGVSVPDRVAIVGVNNDDLLCEGAWPPLSSIEADFSRVGYHAAKLLDRMMSGEAIATEERHVRLAPLGVVQRMSSNVLAVADANLADAIRFIREHACDPCTVHDVLRHVPVGRRWLERQFVAHLGRTPHDEITRVRVEAGQRLLLQPDLSLPEIAQRCGFSAVQNFARLFSQEVGTTPAAYRRNALRGADPLGDPADRHPAAMPGQAPRAGATH
ncbi:MAG TPA: substrate-binding domain-containing protein [Tepidisphaeraceae bacterium]|nr:substrate-binding domain-containing protein [Tepidisphaeraceae bacterium]